MVYSHSAPPRDLRPAGIQKFLLEEERTGDWGGVVAIMVFWGGGGVLGWVFGGVY